MSSASIDQLRVVVVEVDGAVRADTWAITAEKDTLGYFAGCGGRPDRRRGAHGERRYVGER